MNVNNPLQRGVWQNCHLEGQFWSLQAKSLNAGSGVDGAKTLQTSLRKCQSRLIIDCYPVALLRPGLIVAMCFDQLRH